MIDSLDRWKPHKNLYCPKCQACIGQQAEAEQPDCRIAVRGVCPECKERFEIAYVWLVNPSKQ